MRDKMVMVTSTQLSDRVIEVVARPEIELFLYCSRVHIDSQTAECIKVLLQGNIDWNYLIGTTLQFGSTPLLFWNLITLFSEEIPKSISAQMRDIFLINAIKNIALKDELLKLLALLKDNDIPAIPFKGPVLSISAYGKLDRRIFSDLDILVHEQDFLKAKKLLISQGYQTKHDEEHQIECLQAQLLRNDGKVNLDLHYGIPPKYLNLDPECFWESLEPLSISGQTILTLKPEAHLLILCVNGHKERWRLFGKLCDVAAMIQTHQDMDWEWLVAEANRLKIKRILYLALLLANTLLGTTIPQKLLVIIKSDLLMRCLVLESSQHKFNYDLYALTIKENRVFFVLNTLIIPTQADKDLLPLPTSLFFLYYFIRPIRLIVKYMALPIMIRK